MRWGSIIEATRWNGLCNALPLPGVATLMPLSCCRIIAAYNRCTSGVRVALPAYPFPRLTLTSGMSQFGPASGSHRDSGPHHYCGLKVRSVRFNASFLYPRVGIVGNLSLSGGKVRAVGQQRLVVRQDVALGLLIQHIDIMVGQVDDPHPAAGGIDDFRFYG